MGTPYQQAALQVGDPQTFNSVRDAVAASFSTGRVADFLRSLERATLRIRDFETVLAKGLLGSSTSGEYSRLGDGDQGQIRELYLASLEHVAPELRSRYFKLYAYY